MSETDRPDRNYLDEHVMRCSDCGAKLWSIDHCEDLCMKCPYQCGSSGGDLP